MKKLLATALVFGFLFVSTGLCLAADKIGYVNVIRIASEYNKAKDLNKKLESEVNAYEAELEKKTNELKALDDKIRLLSEKEREAKMPELEKKAKEYGNFRRDKETEFRKKDFDNSKEVADDIRAAIKQISEKEGITYVIDDRALVYMPKELDISDKVIEVLNKKSPAKK